MSRAAAVKAVERRWVTGVERVWRGWGGGQSCGCRERREAGEEDPGKPTVEFGLDPTT